MSRSDYSDNNDYILRVFINKSYSYFETIEWDCLYSTKKIKGVVSNICEYTKLVNNNNFTNIPIIHTNKCFQKMLSHGGIVNQSFSFENSSKYCILKDSHYDFLIKLVNNDHLQGEILDYNEEYNVFYLFNFMITITSIILIIAIFIKCMRQGRLDRLVPGGTPSLVISGPTGIIIDTHEQQTQREVHDTLATDEEIPDCSICIEPIRSNNSVVKLPCGHIFHPECIRVWFKGSKRCPNCNDRGKPNKVILPSLNTPILDNESSSSTSSP